jgi:hypothetical protein
VNHEEEEEEEEDDESKGFFRECSNDATTKKTIRFFPGNKVFC